MYVAHVNIGLHTSEHVETENEVIHVQDALNALLEAMPGAELIAYRVEQSDSEPTLVAAARVSEQFDLFQLSEELHQDAIAVRYFENGEIASETLIGPRAELWGEFNPEFFITP